MTVRALVLGLSAAVLITTSACGTKVDNTQHADAIRALVSGTPAWVGRDALAQRLWQIERAFYEARGWTKRDSVATDGKPLWRYTLNLHDNITG